MVRSIDNQGIVQLPELLKFGDQTSDSPVRILDGCGIDGSWIVKGPIARHNLIRSRNWIVGFLEPDIEEKRGLFISFFLKPRDRLVGENLTGIPFQLSYSLPIAVKV